MNYSYNKYSNQKTTVDNIVFASKHEAADYQNLKLRLKKGEIQDLELQVRLPLVVNGIKVATYVVDFRYTENGKTVLADSKGCRTQLFVIKKKLVKALYGIDILET